MRPKVGLGQSIEGTEGTETLVLVAAMLRCVLLGYKKPNTETNEMLRAVRVKA